MPMKMRLLTVILYNKDYGLKGHVADAKKYWKDIVEAEDYDAHMIEAGPGFYQCLPGQNNAEHIPGCGTGQMFEFLRPMDIGNLKYIFSDIKPEFLKKLTARIPRGTNFRTVVDDLEQSSIHEKVEGVLIVLVLQHIGWQQALDNVVSTQPKRIYLIEQEQDATDKEINEYRQLRPTIKKFSDLAKTELINRQDLEVYMNAHGYKLVWQKTEPVPFKKRMFGIVFQRAR
jgi:hypothetical protein